MESTKFAWEIATRLAAILPAGFAARVEGDVIQIEAPDGLGASTSVGHLDPAEAEPEDYADAAWNALSMAQDVVSETTPTPWPAPLGPGVDLAEPGTRAEGRVIHLWFGVEQAPVLRLRPIALDA
jgi:hypothetical protein